MGGSVFEPNLCTKEHPEVADIQPKEAWEMLVDDPNCLLVDVRTVPEWSYVGYPDLSELGKDVIFQSWRIYPSMEVDDSFASSLAQKVPGKDTKLLFICKIGGRSYDAALSMAHVGYNSCFNIAGGFEGDTNMLGQRGSVSGWKYEGLPWRQQ